jgi:hypothetical protein
MSLMLPKSSAARAYGNARFTTSLMHMAEHTCWLLLASEWNSATWVNCLVFWTWSLIKAFVGSITKVTPSRTIAGKVKQSDLPLPAHHLQALLTPDCLGGGYTLFLSVSSNHLLSAHYACYNLLTYAYWDVELCSLSCASVTSCVLPVAWLMRMYGCLAIVRLIDLI